MLNALIRFSLRNRPLILGVAVLLLYSDSPQLVPALKSYWLVIHVSAAIIAGGAFTAGTALNFGTGVLD